jgi:hypothetical protein
VSVASSTGACVEPLAQQRLRARVVGLVAQRERDPRAGGEVALETR